MKVNNEQICYEDYAPPSREQADVLAEEIMHDIELPIQQDGWGGVSATGAFILDRLTGQSPFVTVSELDTAMDRKPGSPGDSSKLSVEFLTRGMSIDTFAPVSPLDVPAKKLVNGEMSYEEYIKIYEDVLGPIPEGDQDLYRHYYMDTFIPAVLAVEERFASYKETGQMQSHEGVPITKSLVAAQVNSGKYVFASVKDEGQSGTSPVVIFRPNLDLPAMTFVPGQDQAENGGSFITPFTNELLQLASREAIGAIALWQE